MIDRYINGDITLTDMLELILEILLILLLVILVIFIVKYVLLFIDLIQVRIAVANNVEQELNRLYTRLDPLLDTKRSMSTNLLIYISIASIAVILSVAYKFWQ